MFCYEKIPINVSLFCYAEIADATNDNDIPLMNIKLIDDKQKVYIYIKNYRQATF